MNTEDQKILGDLIKIEQELTMINRVRNQICMKMIGNKFGDINEDSDPKLIELMNGLSEIDDKNEALYEMMMGYLDEDE